MEGEPQQPFDVIQDQIGGRRQHQRDEGGEQHPERQRDGHRLQEIGLRALFQQQRRNSRRRRPSCSARTLRSLAGASSSNDLGEVSPMIGWARSTTDPAPRPATGCRPWSICAAGGRTRPARAPRATTVRRCPPGVAPRSRLPPWESVSRSSSRGASPSWSTLRRTCPPSDARMTSRSSRPTRPSRSRRPLAPKVSDSTAPMRTPLRSSTFCTRLRTRLRSATSDRRGPLTQRSRGTAGRG